jgi:hypothetical protein
MARLPIPEMHIPEDPSPLSVRIGAEALCGIVSALLVAPAVSIIDKAIVSNASGREKLVPCLLNGIKELVKTPIKFIKQPSFLLIWGVYSGTYIVANSIQGICERERISEVYPKFIGSSIANISLSVAKDRLFARMFGDPTKPVRPMPMPSMSLFAIRDSMTILASFTLPPIIAKKFQERWGISRNDSEYWSQLLTPVSMQIFSTPLHLFGLDLYNRPEGMDRLEFIKREYLKTTLARMSRIFPAFGVGGVVNKALRKDAIALLRDQYSCGGYLDQE